jgi:hypothetical protein
MDEDSDPAKAIYAMLTAIDQHATYVSNALDVG